MRTIEYTPQNVCSRKLLITLDGDVVVKIESIGGCHGNLQGVGILAEGMKVEEVIRKLDGIKCRGSRTGQTSCPDQIAHALKNL